VSELPQENRLEALSLENQHLKQQLDQAKEELRLEAENLQLKERLAIQQLRNKASRYNFLAQGISRAPKPIAKIVLWLSYFAPFYFLTNAITIANGSQSNSYTILLSVLQTITVMQPTGDDPLIQVVAAQAKSFKTFSGLMVLISFWLVYTTLKWHYKGAPRAKSIIARVIQNPFIPLVVYAACRAGVALSKSTQDFYAVLLIYNYRIESITSIIRQLDLPKDIESYYGCTIGIVIKITLWTLFAVLLNKEVQKKASSQDSSVQ